MHPCDVIDHESSTQNLHSKVLEDHGAIYIYLTIYKRITLTVWCNDDFPENDLTTGRGVVTPYNGLYGESPPERGTFFKLQVCKRVGISQVKVYKRVGISVI